MATIPCIDCITLPVCSQQRNDRGQVGSLVELAKKCYMVDDYLQLKDVDIELEPPLFTEVQGTRIVEMLNFMNWRNNGYVNEIDTTKR